MFFNTQLELNKHRLRIEKKHYAYLRPKYSGCALLLVEMRKLYIGSCLYNIFNTFFDQAILGHGDFQCLV